MWFRFDGDQRPVIVGVSTANGGATDQTDSSQFISTDSDVYKFFNFYESQWPSSSNKNQEKGFPWMQWGDPVPNENGFVSVSVAQHSAASVFFSDRLMNSSRGYNGKGGKETDWKQGANFQWQWDTAFAYDKAGLVKNIFITGTTGFAFRVACFWYLDHHKAPVTAILGIELHDGMRSRRRPRKEIQYDIFAIRTGGLRD